MRKYLIFISILLAFEGLGNFFANFLELSDEIIMFFEIGIYLIFTVKTTLLWRKANGIKYFILQLPIITNFFFSIVQIIVPILVFYLINTKDQLDSYYQFITAETVYLPHITVTIRLSFYSMIVFWIGVYFAKDKEFKFLLKIFKFDDKPIKIQYLVIIYLLGIGARFTLMKLDIYGYTFNFDKLSANAQYKVIFTTIAQLCTLSFFLIALFHRAKYRILYYSIIISEIIFSFASGFKSDVIMIGIIIFIIQYLETSKVKIKYVFILVGSIFVAYAIIEPLRQIRQLTDESSASSYITTVFDAVSESKDYSEKKNENTDNLFIITLMERFDITTNSTRAILYKDKIGVKDSDPDFLKHLIFVPFYAVIPRILWKDKPEFTYGVWFNRNVILSDFPEWSDLSGTSAAIGPIGYLYLCGGVPLILIFSLLFGFLSNMFTKTLIIENFNFYSFILYLSIIMNFVGVEHHNLYNHIFKTLPIMVIILKIMNKKLT